MGQLSPYISAWWAGTKVQEEQKMGRRVGIAEGRANGYSGRRDE